MFNRFLKCFCCFHSLKTKTPQTQTTITRSKSFESVSTVEEAIQDIEWNWKNTIPFVPPINEGIVIKVYDGDTITIAAKLPYKESPMYRFSVRLNGIDCPEIKGETESEKECAQIAKQLITDLALQKVVTLKNVQTEKYGRILADVYVGDIHLNALLVEKKLAVKYDGGTKKSPEDWLQYYYGG